MMTGDISDTGVMGAPRSIHIIHAGYFGANSYVDPLEEEEEAVAEMIIVIL